MHPDKLLSEVEALPVPESFDADAHAARYLQDAILRTRTEYFRTNCPPQYQHFDIEHESIQANRAAIERVLAWRYSAKGILASGPTGLGKTRSVFALCKRLLIEECRDVGIWRANLFFSELQQCIRYGRDEAGDFVKRQSERPILFIDDYGQEALLATRDEWAQGWFFDLMDRRIGSGLPMLITTNLTARDMATDKSNVSANPFVRRVLELCEPVKFL